jgi:hypothetical protein
MSARPLAQLMGDERRAATERATAANNEPVVQSLTALIRKHWTIAKQAKVEVERDMLRALRALRGEYTPEKLSQLKSQGSSEIYMMLFATKARQAKALMGDVLLGTGDDKPWSLRPTPVSDLPPDIVEEIMGATSTLVQQAEQGPAPMSVEQIRQLLRDAKTHAEAAIALESRVRCSRAETKLEDMMAEGGFVEALDEFLDDMMVFKSAFLKGPVVRKKGTLEWVQGEGGTYEPQVSETNKPCWERVDPLMMYPAPWAKGVNDAFLIERHRLSVQSLNELIGVEGYSEDAIREVISAHGTGGLREWLSIDTERSSAEGRAMGAQTAGSDLIDALQYWGQVTGKLLIEWGLDPEEVPDESKVYEVEAWLVGNWVIKAAINADPLARRPYYTDSFKRQPGAFWNLSLYDTMSDCEDMCNAAARALSNNMGIASGPQVWINVDRLPQGEDITALYPWKITQTTSDPMGSSAAPMGFFQPPSNASELMGVFEKFSQLADEYTGIPRYMTGDGAAGGAGRTASGMSMMIGNAGKTTKSSVSSLDLRVIGPAVSRGYEFIMRYVGDPDLKGDLNVVARGALSLMTKDAAQVRRNEFMTLALQSPIVQQMIGPEGLASLLRATTRTLDLDSASIVPSDSELRIKMQQMQIAQQQQAMAQQGQPGQPSAGPQGPTASAELANGAPATDNFGA